MSDGDESIQFMQDDEESSSLQFEHEAAGTPVETSLRSRRSRANSRLSISLKPTGGGAEEVVDNESFQFVVEDGGASVSSAPGGWFVSGNTDPDDDDDDDGPAPRHVPATATKAAANASDAVYVSSTRRRGASLTKHTPAPPTVSITRPPAQQQQHRPPPPAVELQQPPLFEDNGSIAFTVEESLASSPDMAASSSVGGGGGFRQQGDDKKKTVVSAVLRERGGSVARQMRQNAAARAALLGASLDAPRGGASSPPASMPASSAAAAKPADASQKQPQTQNSQALSKARPVTHTEQQAASATAASPPVAVKSPMLTAPAAAAAAGGTAAWPHTAPLGHRSSQELLDFPPLPRRDADIVPVQQAPPVQPAAALAGDAAVPLPAASAPGVQHPRTSSKLLVLQHLLEQETTNLFVQKATSSSSTAFKQDAASGPTPSKQRQTPVVSFPLPGAAPAVHVDDTPFTPTAALLFQPPQPAAAAAAAAVAPLPGSRAASGVSPARAAKIAAAVPPPPCAATEAVGYSVNVSWVTPSEIDAARQVAAHMKLYKEVMQEELAILDGRLRAEQLQLARDHLRPQQQQQPQQHQHKVPMARGNGSRTEAAREALAAIAADRQQAAGGPRASRPQTADGPAALSMSNVMTASAARKRAPSAQPILLVPKVVIGDGKMPPRATSSSDPNRGSKYQTGSQRKELQTSAAARPTGGYMSRAPGAPRTPDKQHASEDYGRLHAKASQDAYGSTAASFGIIWPPNEQTTSSSNSQGAAQRHTGQQQQAHLYFVSGVRLTDQQVTQFYCAAEERHRQSRSANGGVTANAASAPVPRGLDFLLLSQTVSPRGVPAPNVVAPASCADAGRTVRRGRSNEKENATSHSHAMDKPATVAAAPLLGAHTAPRPRRNRTHVLQEVFRLLDVDGTGRLLGCDLLRLRAWVQLEAAATAAMAPTGCGDEPLLRASARHRGATTPAGVGGASHSPSKPLAATASSRTRHGRLCEFASDVVLPLVIESGAPVVDFPLLAMVVQQQLRAAASGAGTTLLHRTGAVWHQFADGLLEALRA